MVEAGADVVAGHGSHVVEPTERYDGGFIVYGLGNLLFDGPRRGAPVLQVTLRREDGDWVVDRSSSYGSSPSRRAPNAD
jgi:hypothetical protein